MYVDRQTDGKGTLFNVQQLVSLEIQTAIITEYTVTFRIMFLYTNNLEVHPKIS